MGFGTRKFTAALALPIAFFIQPLIAAGQSADLNAPATFYDRWQGEVSFASFGTGDTLRFQLARAKQAGKILFVTTSKTKPANTDTVVCAFNDGVFELPMEGRGTKGNACNGRLQFSLLDTTNMTASFYTEANDCERISFRGQRINEETKTESPVAKGPSGASLLGAETKPSAEEAEDPVADEALFIQKFGGGKVRRASKTLLQLTLNSGKPVYLRDKGKDEDENQTRYRFAGVDEALNSFVIDLWGWEWSNHVFVNKVSGKQAILVSREYTLSPNKKWLAAFTNDLESDLQGSFVQVCAVAANGLAEAFSKQTDEDEAKRWAPNTVRWISDTVLEIDKVVPSDADEQKPAGKIWLAFKAGKWQWAKSKPAL